MVTYITRRLFLKLLIFSSFGLIGLGFIQRLMGGKRTNVIRVTSREAPMKSNYQDISYIYESQNGTPEQNMVKVIEMMGGIQSIIGKDDIVILKPNAQWWNQGMTNTNAMKGFIELILAMPEFRGEVIIAENHHYFDYLRGSNIRGWITEKRNGDFNLNELVTFFQNKGYKNVTKYHWIDAGMLSKDSRLIDKMARPFKHYLKTVINRQESKIVSGPGEGDGYVWTNIDYTYGDKKTKMTYPIFTSKFSKKTIDFKNGIWSHNEYTKQPLKFINFPTLNHHDFAGVTSSVKNYLGIVDLTCGFKGVEPKGYVNFHYMGIPGLGGAVGTFMRTIRKADLNIVTAHWIGFASRTNTELAIKTKTILAGRDPVALDYYAGKYLLLPLRGPSENFNNPDNTNGPFRRYLELCSEIAGGVLDENRIKVRKYNFNS